MELLIKSILLAIGLTVVAAKDDLQSLRNEMNEKVDRLEQELGHVKSQLFGKKRFIFFFNFKRI